MAKINPETVINDGVYYEPITRERSTGNGIYGNLLNMRPDRYIEIKLFDNGQKLVEVNGVKFISRQPFSPYYKRTR